MMKKKNMGIIKLNGVHNAFLTREILDYKLSLKYDIRDTIISSGKIKSNNEIYTDLKFSNEIREKGGQEFIFSLLEDHFYNSNIVNISMLNRNDGQYLFETIFHLYKVNKLKNNLNFILEDEMQSFSFFYERVEKEFLKIKLNYFKVASKNLDEKDSLRLFMWFSSNLGKQSFIDCENKINNLVNYKKGMSVFYGHDLHLNGEVFNSKNKSILQFKKKIVPEIKDFKFEKYEKGNYTLHLDYSIKI
jgi:hypothetical protein